ncbi:hypothetical protein TWF730_002490 [Orbilia blumenaviensis]|uniref:F-box domain-containing protein n=1 Tax=Orbilia blumenaviensis TaxID=1796055 RepID=A0AAV9UAU8_9PEZI
MDTLSNTQLAPAACAKPSTPLPGIPDNVDWFDDFFYDPGAGTSLLIRYSKTKPSEVILRASIQRSGKITLWCHGPILPFTAPPNAGTSRPQVFSPNALSALYQKYITPTASPKTPLLPHRISPLEDELILSNIPPANPPIIQTSTFHNLPSHIFLKICNHTPPGDLLNLSQTCRSFLQTISHENFLWFSKFEGNNILGACFGNWDRYDATKDYMRVALAFINGTTSSNRGYCGNCFEWRTGLYRTFVGPVDLVLFCRECLFVRYPQSTPFYLPTPAPSDIPDWPNYLLSWCHHNRLSRGMTFHTNFTPSQFLDLINQRKWRIITPNPPSPSTTTTPVNITDIENSSVYTYTVALPNVKPVGKRMFDGGDCFGVYEGSVRFVLGRDRLFVFIRDPGGLSAGIISSR